jgi:hypothetical protein
MGLWDTWVKFTSSGDKFLLKILEREQITVYYCSLSGAENGIYSWNSDPKTKPLICLSKRLQAEETFVAKRSTIWECLGYHFTATPAERQASFFRYSKTETSPDRYAWQEPARAALTWAADRLLAEHDIWRIATLPGPVTLRVAAARLRVTEEILAARLNALQQENPRLWYLIVNNMAESSRQWQQFQLIDGFRLIG